MKTIPQKINNADLIRINKITRSFRFSKRGNCTRMLETLANEINRTENQAVKGWLIKFYSILKNYGGQII